MSSAVHRPALPESGRILLTGSAGQVGRELLQTLSGLGEVVAPSRQEMDLGNGASVRDTVRRVRPRWIVNPAAYTAVDKAETEPELAEAVNAEAVSILAEEARDLGAGVLHFSTDYVFDGAKATPYVESDPTGPLGVYGRTKLAGERALGESGAAHAIFRTSWVFAPTGKNFLLTILRLARERETLRIVADQHGSPTWSRDLANLATRFIVKTEQAVQGRELAEVLQSAGGVYHASGSGYTTWYDFAREIVSLAREKEPSVHFAEIEPITTAEFPTPARRPANSRLSCEKLEKQVGWTMMDWRDSLRRVMAEV